MKTINITYMESKKFANDSKKKGVRLYKKKMRSIHECSQYHIGRVKCLASKSNDKILDLTSQIAAIEKTTNKTTAHNKLLQRYH